jgi:mannose/cellobiose epimerase-like protein (N-acyl-D-glucosamine 2-epimerase family)
MPLPPAEVSAVLDRCVQPVVERLVDERHGGFLVDLDHRLRPTGPHRKTIEHVSRTTLALGRLHAARPDGGYGPLLRHGCRYLIDVMWDHEHGGFYAAVERDGAPCWEGLKHPHGPTYVARAFVLAADVLAPGEAFEWARRSQAWLDDVAWDPVHGGYRGTFRRDGEPYEPGDRVPTDDGMDPIGMPVGHVEVNTIGDAIGTLVDLVPLGLGDAGRLAELVDLTLRAVQPPGLLPYLFRPDWTVAPMPARLGHQFQVVRRLVAAGDVLDDGGRATAAAVRLATFALDACRHPGGGYPFEVGPMGWVWSYAGSASDRREWWVQLEAIDAAHVAARRVGDEDERARLLAEGAALWRWFVARYVDTERGGLRAEPAPGRRRRDDRAPKAHRWKDISHETAVLLDLVAGA